NQANRCGQSRGAGECSFRLRPSRADTPREPWVRRAWLDQLRSDDKGDRVLTVPVLDRAENGAQPVESGPVHQSGDMGRFFGSVSLDLNIPPLSRVLEVK